MKKMQKNNNKISSPGEQKKFTWRRRISPDKQEHSAELRLLPLLRLHPHLTCWEKKKSLNMLVLIIVEAADGDGDASLLVLVCLSIKKFTFVLFHVVVDELLQPCYHVHDGKSFRQSKLFLHVQILWRVAKCHRFCRYFQIPNLVQKLLSV